MTEIAIRLDGFGTQAALAVVAAGLLLNTSAGRAVAGYAGHLLLQCAMVALLVAVRLVRPLRSPCTIALYHYCRWAYSPCLLAGHYAEALNIADGDPLPLAVWLLGRVDPANWWDYPPIRLYHHVLATAEVVMVDGADLLAREKEGMSAADETIAKLITLGCSSARPGSAAFLISLQSSEGSFGDSEVNEIG